VLVASIQSLNVCYVWEIVSAHHSAHVVLIVTTILLLGYVLTAQSVAPHVIRVDA